MLLDRCADVAVNGCGNYDNKGDDRENQDDDDDPQLMQMVRNAFKV